MIKRRFYKHDHGDGDKPSDYSSSSSDSELEAEATEETDAEDDVVAEVKEKDEACSTSSGYESEDSSANDVDVDPSGLSANDDDIKTGNDEQNISESHASAKRDAETFYVPSNTVAKEDSFPSGAAGCILKCKSIFKCRLCPRIVCLTEETMNAHLKSKRHARSEKLLSEGRLKLMLNSDGEIEGETHAERHASTVASVQNTEDSKKKNKGRQRQRKRLKKNMGAKRNFGKAGQLTKNTAKRRRKGEI